MKARKKQTNKHMLQRRNIKNLFAFIRICRKASKNKPPFKNATNSEVKTLTRIVKLIISDKLPIEKNKLKHLKKYKKEFRSLTQNTKSGIHLKKKILNQTGRGILSLLPIISGVLGSIFSK